LATLEFLTILQSSSLQIASGLLSNLPFAPKMIKIQDYLRDFWERLARFSILAAKHA